MKAAEQRARDGLPLYDDLQKDRKQGQHGTAVTHHFELGQGTVRDVR